MDSSVMAKIKKRTPVVAFMVVFALLGLSTLLLSSAGSETAFQRPFSADSIWNTPIGSDAVYVDSGLPYTPRNPIDYAHFLELSASDPLRDYIVTGGWRKRCSGTEQTGTQLNLPDGYTIPDASQNSRGGWVTPNNGFEFLLPDGRSVFTGSGSARCSGTGPMYGSSGNITYDINGDGLKGGHGASKLPLLGGSIRPGELTDDEPIQHVLDLVLYTKYAYSDNKTTKESTYRWPASGSDNYALDKSRNDVYVGTNSEMRIGSLLALPPSLMPEDLQITSDVGRKLFAALQDWGAYFTEDSAWDANYLVVDEKAKGTFSWGDQQKQEMGRMVDALHVVANNGPNSIGGGGTPRAEKHPRFQNVNANATVPPQEDEAEVAESVNDQQEELITASESYTVGVSITASSEASEVFTAQNAVDGDEQGNEKRWISQPADNQYVTVDLGELRFVDAVSVVWAGNTTKDYRIEISNDGASFTSAGSGQTNNEATYVSNDVVEENARFIRIIGVSRWNENFGHSIRELAIFATDPVEESEGPVSVPFRINSGGDEYQDDSGNNWSADQYFLDGGGTYGTYSVNRDINATNNDTIYQTERWCMAGYSIPVNSGSYTVQLHFAEINPVAGNRVFGLSLEGVSVLENVNLNSVVGTYTAYQSIHDVVVTDNELNISFSRFSGCPKISGIEILPLQILQDDQPPVVTLTSPQNLTEVSETTTIIVAVSDNESVESVEAFVDGGSIGIQTSEQYVFSFDSKNYENGVIDVQVTASDPAGNTSVEVFELIVANEIPDTTPPSQPRNLSARDVSSASALLQWDSSSDDVSEVSYELYRNGSIFAITSDNTYLDSNVDPETEYTYFVRAIDESNNESLPSNELIVEIPTPPDTTPPTPPGSVTAEQNEATVVISWSVSTDEGSGVNSYYVYRNNEVVAITSSLRYTDENIAGGTSYQYYVRAVDNEDNISQKSDVKTITVAVVDSEPPSTPSRLRHVSYQWWKGQFNFTWSRSNDNSGEAVQYIIYRNGINIATTARNSFADATIFKNVPYNYRVSAVDSSGNESDRSNNLYFKGLR